LEFYDGVIKINLLTLVGLYILISGELIIGKFVHLKGKFARIYGLLLIVSSQFIQWILNIVITLFFKAGVSLPVLLVLNFAGTIIIAVLLGILVAKLEKKYSPEQKS